VLISDGMRIYATRHAINHECPSLYYTTDDDSFPEDAQLVASERLTEGGLWQAVPEHHVLILDPQAPPELLAL
jgi:glutamine amidotransferase